MIDNEKISEFDYCYIDNDVIVCSYCFLPIDECNCAD